MAQCIRFDREIGEKLRNGFYLRTPSEDVGQFTDCIELKFVPRKRVSFTRIVDEVVQNGMYLRAKNDGQTHSWNLFRNEQTGLLADREIFENSLFEKGEILTINLIPFGKNMVTIELVFNPK